MTTSNKDLIAAIALAAEENKVDVPDTEGKNNAALVEILDGLKNVAPPPPASDAEAEVKAKEEAEVKAKEEAEVKAKEEAEVKAKEEAEAKAKEEAEAEEVKPPYYMAEGKSVTSKRGILADGDEVKAEYFPGGKGTLEKLVKDGYVIKS